MLSVAGQVRAKRQDTRSNRLGMHLSRTGLPYGIIVTAKKVTERSRAGRMYPCAFPERPQRQSRVTLSRSIRLISDDLRWSLRFIISHFVFFRDTSCAPSSSPAASLLLASVFQRKRALRIQTFERTSVFSNSGNFMLISASAVFAPVFSAARSILSLILGAGSRGEIRGVSLKGRTAIRIAGEKWSI